MGFFVFLRWSAEFWFLPEFWLPYGISSIFQQKSDVLAVLAGIVTTHLYVAFTFNFIQIMINNNKHRRQWLNV